MSDMRKLINLFEAVVPDEIEIPVDPELAIAAEPEVGYGEKLTGVVALSASAIETHFPSVTDSSVFYRAWRKVTANKEEILNRYELWELGRAFIDLMRMDEVEKMRVMRKLILIHMPAGSEDEPTRIKDL
jgi:hypothetical protein